MSDPHSSLPVALGNIALPSQLSAAAATAVRELIAEAASVNSVRSYETAIRYWVGWYQLRFDQPFALPLSVASVLQFIVDHAARLDEGGQRVWELPKDIDLALVRSALKAKTGPWSTATVVHRLAVLSIAHRLKDQPNPCEQPAVRKLLQACKRAAWKRLDGPKKKSAITAELLNAMLATCDDSLMGKRDRALLCFGFSSGGRRRSEIATAALRNLRAIGSGYLYQLNLSKTQKDADDNANADKPLVGSSAVAMRTWLEAAGISEGAIFRRLFKTTVGPALSCKSVAAIIKKRAALAGMNSQDIGGHSLRHGFVTECGKQSVPIGAVMAMTGHRSVSSVMGYYQAGGAEHNPAAMALDAAVSGNVSSAVEIAGVATNPTPNACFQPKAQTKACNAEVGPGTRYAVAPIF